VKLAMQMFPIKKPTEKQYLKYLKITQELTEDEINILYYTKSPKSNREIQEDCLGLKRHNDNFKKYIEPLLNNETLTRTLPNVPNSPLQKYFTTNIGNVIILIFEENKRSQI
jgi:ATP-dependent DNA helicase RecG